MIRYILVFLVITSSAFGSPKGLAVCAIFQNEGPYLKEWIDYYASHGAEHFYLYNNNSSDNFRDVLEPYIESELVELIEWPSIQDENDWYHYSFTIQPGAYNDALSKAKNLYKWLAIIDIDEYIVCPKDKNILTCLEKYYPKCSGVCANWVMYGTSQVYQAPEGKMLQHLLMRAPLDFDMNLYYKSIVQPLHVKGCINPHYCIYTKKHWHVDANKNRFEMESLGIFVDKIRINHYWAKDEWFLENVKIPRYEKWGGNADHVRSIAEKMNVEFDDIILRI